jgi:hypothetical protein
VGRGGEPDGDTTSASRIATSAKSWLRKSGWRTKPILAEGRQGMWYKLGGDQNRRMFWGEGTQTKNVEGNIYACLCLVAKGNIFASFFAYFPRNTHI